MKTVMLALIALLIITIARRRGVLFQSPQLYWLALLPFAAFGFYAVQYRPGKIYWRLCVRKLC